jgi:hypothetical protein
MLRYTPGRGESHAHPVSGCVGLLGYLAGRRVDAEVG